MAEAANAGNGEAKGKKVVEITQVQMEDGRTVGFAGNRRMLKDTIIDPTKLQVDGNSIMLSEGAVAVRLDFRNGKTLTFTPPVSLIAQTVGHGLEQKLGDETAGEKDIDDMVLAVEDLAKRLAQGEWNVARESGGFSGASVVIKAIMEVTGKPIDVVKNFLQGKLDAAKAKGEKLSRAELYASFRVPGTPTYAVIKRLEDEKLAKGAKSDANADLAALSAQA